MAKLNTLFTLTNNKTTTTMKAQAIKSEIALRVKKDFKKSLTQLKKDVYATLDKFGSTEHFSGNGYAVFYTANKNFMGGSKNGGGAGYYARLRFTGMTKDIKL